MLSLPVPLTETDLTALPSGQDGEAAELLADAFLHDPAMVGLLADQRRRRLLLERWYGSLLWVARRHARRPVLAAERGGRLVGVAVSYGENRYPPPGRTAGAHAPALLRAGPRASIRAARWFAVRGATRPEAAHYLYLELLGVAPSAQRTGVGDALLAHLLTDAKERALALVLHTNEAENLAYYERYGFAVTQSTTLPHRAPEWLMERPAPTGNV